MAPLAPAARTARLHRFFARHPVLLLALLTPGIPEYLSGSSSPAVLALSPPVFLLFLALNVGMYTGGVLLIREARVRWGLGWLSVLVLGAAYGIAEEGLALTTLFDPHNSQVSAATAGALGGVNWEWTAGILPFHAIFSVALPIYFLDRALPELRGRSLVVGRALALAFAAYLGTVLALGLGFALRVYWMGVPVLLGALAAIAGLILLARAVPSDGIAVPVGPAVGTPRQLFAAGFLAFPAMLLLPGLAAAAHLPFVLGMTLDPALWALYAVVVLPRLGTVGGDRAALAFAAGLIAPLFLSGLLVGWFRDPIGEPFVLLGDGAMAAFLLHLYRTAGGTSSLPGSAGAAAVPAPAG